MKTWSSLNLQLEKYLLGKFYWSPSQQEECYGTAHCPLLNFCGVPDNVLNENLKQFHSLERIMRGWWWGKKIKDDVPKRPSGLKHNAVLASRKEDKIIGNDIVGLNGNAYGIPKIWFSSSQVKNIH